MDGKAEDALKTEKKEKRRSVRCAHCHLNQWVAERCRRCKKLLPTLFSEPDDSARAANFRIPLPTLKEVKLALVQRALADADGDVVKGAKLIGVSKNFIYRTIERERVSI